MNATAAGPLATAAILAVTLNSCASSLPRDASVDFSDNYRFAGSLDGVRVDAQILGQSRGSSFRVVYEIENRREDDIALVPEASLASYSDLERTITLSLGAEVPREEMILERIRPGERRRFTTTTRASETTTAHPRIRQAARFVRVKLIYLRQLEGLDLNREDDERSAVRITDSVLPRWLERNASLVTNALPFRSRSGPAATGADRRGPATVPSARPGSL